MSRKPTDWECRELERLLNDAVDADPGNPKGVYVILIAFLGALGYAVLTYGPDAIALAEKILYAGR